MRNIKKMPIRILGLIIIMFSIILGSCIQDIRDLTKVRSVQMEDDYNPDFAIPLVHANLSALNFANKFNVDDIVRIEDDYLITILYKSKDWKAYARDYIEISNQQYYLGPLTYNTGGSDSIRVTTNILFDENEQYNLNFNEGEEIVTLKVKSGKIILNINSTFPRSGQLEFTLLYATKNNIQYSKTIPLNYKWPQINMMDTIDIAGFEFDLTKGAAAYNSIPAKYAITLNSNSRFVHASDEISVTTNFEDLEFAYIEGYLGANDIPFSSDTMKLSIFDGTEADRVSFVDPKLIVNIENSTGMPIRIEPPYINSFSKKTGNLPLTGSVVSSPIDINYPKLTEVGDIALTGIIANKDNSNLDDIVNKMPKYFDYDLTVLTNPDGKTHDNFALDTSYVKVNLNMELPAFGRSEKWEFDFPTKVDPIDFDLKIIEKAEFSILIENDFPIEIALQIYILDSNETVIDSLLDNNEYFIESAQIGTDYRTISTNKSITKIIVNRDRLDNVAQMRKLRAVLSVSTKNKGTEDVKIFADSRMDIKIGLRTKIKLNLNE